MKKQLLLFAMMLLPMVVSAEDVEIDGIRYILNSDESTAEVVSLFSGKYSGDVTIPSSINYKEITYNVTAIGGSAFLNSTSLTSLSIPGSVTSIGNDAFLGCTSLSSIDFPNSITYVGDCYLADTPWYSNQPDGLIYVGKAAFKYKGEMSANTQITLKDGTTCISPYAFFQCSNLTSVKIPEGVTSIGNAAFNSTGLTSATIPNSIEDVGTYAFNNTPWLENQPNGMFYIGKVLYRYKESSDIKSVVVKEGTISISCDAFSYCSNLTSISLPESLTEIECQAFYNCTSITSMIIPENVTSIGSDVFSGCDNLSTLQFLSNNPTNYSKEIYSYVTGNEKRKTIFVPLKSYSQYYYLWNKLYNKEIIYLGENTGSCGEDITYNFDESTGMLVISGEGTMMDFTYNQRPWESFKSSIKKLVVETGVTSISDGAFRECINLSSVTIPRSVDYVGRTAFMGTAWLENQPDGLIYAGKVAFKYKGEMPDNTQIAIKDGTLSIADGAFTNCSGLTSITIPNSVTSIGNSTFSYCKSLSSINIPDNITRIGSEIFRFCSNLISVNIPDNVTSIGGAAFSGCSSLISVNIPDNVISIGESAFLGCSSLTSIDIPESVIKLEESAFSGCSSLTSVNIPNNVTYLSNNVFKNCSSLTSINIPDNVTSIGSYAFSGCSSLTSVDIPNSITSIDQSAFADCSGLTSVEIPNSVTYFGGSVFYNCTELISITIGDAITNIYSSSFLNCPNLKSIVVGKNNTCFDSRDNCNAIINTSTNELILGCNNTVIPNDVTSIGSYAFYKCNGLSTIYIPESVISIKDDSFIECIGLTSISVDKANAKYDSRDNCNAIIETESNRLIVACSNSIIPKGVSSFNNNALRNCISLALPDGIEKITQSMFDGCVKLVTLKIPGSVKVIEENAFNSCSSLKNVIFENGKDSLKFSLFYVNYYAKPVWFSSCPLDSIYIGRNIKYDFTPKGYGTYSLSPFREKETLRKVVFGDNVTIIPSAMFDGCVNLTSVETPEKMDSIGHSAFKGCEKLSSFKMPQGIRTIDNNAFYKCKSLTSVDIPGTVEKIGESAFYYCED